MSVGILIIAHEGIGEGLLATANSMFRRMPLRCKVLNAHGNEDPDMLVNKAKKLVKLLDKGSGVLILTDIYGATPCNVAVKILTDNVRCVAGINLPMLVRVLNYPKLSIAELADKAFAGGKEGVMRCTHG